MNKQQFLKEFKNITENMYTVVEQKNHDYNASDDNPFTNFTMVEVAGVASTEQGFYTRMTDKLMRFASFIRTGTLKVADEKIEDTLLDLANYAVLCVCYLRSKRQ